MSILERAWYRPDSWSRLLAPLAWLYGRVAKARRRAFTLHPERRYRAPVPVVVVGNISVGGTGKTPVISALAEHLRRAGWQPGIVSRGYGGRSAHYPLRVNASTAPAECGDEPLLLAQRTACPVVVDPNRSRAVQALLEGGGCNLVLSDDGLQHYALDRDIEIAVVDAVRGLGNGRLLPAGPLREPPARLSEVDFLVANGGAWPGATLMQLRCTALVQLTTGRRVSPADWQASPCVHAVAGIGNPERFFTTLTQLGFQPEPHPLPDHHDFEASDLDFADGLPVIMTEKDAVKCRRFARPEHWYLEVEADLPDEFLAALLQRLRQISPGS